MCCVYMVKKIENIDHQGKWNRYLFAIKTTAFYACRSCDMRPPPSGCRCCGDTNEGCYILQRADTAVIVG